MKKSTRPITKNGIVHWAKKGYGKRLAGDNDSVT